MPIIINKSSANLQGVCTVEDAEPLLQWLLENPGGKVRLKDCVNLHCSVLQTLLIAHAKCVGTPADPDLNAWVEAALSGLKPLGPTQMAMQVNGRREK